MNTVARRPSALAPLALALAPLPGAAQQFAAGELYLHTPAHDVAGGGKGLVRIDPHTGATELVLAYDAIGGGSGAAYDPFRDRVLVHARIGAEEGLWAVARDGSAQLLLADTNGFHSVAPTGDGRVYLAPYAGPKNVLVLDAGDALHALLDASGAAPFAYGGGELHLAYSPATKSLVTASDAALWPCAGAGADLTLRRIPLAPDGLAVGGPVECADVDVAQDHLDPGQFSHGPGGKLVYQTDWHDAYLVDEEALDLVPLVSIEPTGYDLDAGTWSRSLGLFVYLETSQDELRALQPGATGPAGIGALLSDQGVSKPLSSGEDARLFEVGAPSTNGGLSVAVGAGAISVAAGGAQGWALDLGPAHAGELYLVLGSVTGWWPGLDVGAATLPLALDAWTLATLNHPNQAPLQASLGALDGAGRASAAFVLPAGVAPSIVGVTAHHAAVALAAGAATAATNPVALTFLP